MGLRKRVFYVALLVAAVAELFFIIDAFADITPLTGTYFNWAKQFYEDNKPFTYAVWIAPVIVSFLTLSALAEFDDGGLGCLIVIIVFGLTFGFV